MKKTVSLILAAILLLLSSTNVFAVWSQGYDGESLYTTQGNCAFGDRAGAQYVQNLHDKLKGYGIANSGTVDGQQCTTVIFYGTGAILPTNKGFAAY